MNDLALRDSDYLVPDKIEMPTPAVQRAFGIKSEPQTIDAEFSDSPKIFSPVAGLLGGPSAPAAAAGEAAGAAESVAGGAALGGPSGAAIGAGLAATNWALNTLGGQSTKGSIAEYLQAGGSGGPDTGSVGRSVLAALQKLAGTQSRM